MGIQGVTRGYWELEGVTGGYKGLQGVTRGYKGLQGVTRSDRRWERVTKDYRKFDTYNLILKFLSKTMDQNLWRNSNFAFFIKSCFYSP